MTHSGLAVAVAGLMLLTALAPAWGDEVVAPYPQLFPAQPMAADVPATTTESAAAPPRQASKATGASSVPAHRIASGFPLTSAAQVLAALGVLGFMIFAVATDSSFSGTSDSGGGGSASGTAVSSTSGT